MSDIHISHQNINRIRYTLIGVLIFVAAPVFTLSYEVVKNDTLFGLAESYDVPIAWIIRANNLDDEKIIPGQTLEIPVEGDWEITVRRGDTLSGLAWELGIKPEILQNYNQLDSDKLIIGQRLKLPEIPDEGTYIVQPGDTLTAIARRNNISLEDLKRINEITETDGIDRIFPGQKLNIFPPQPVLYRVDRGESLWLIAKTFAVAIEDLKKWNSLEGDTIQPGQELTLYPGTPLSDSADIQRSPVALAASPVTKPTLPQLGEYFFSAPEKENQPSAQYWESPTASAAVDYRRATQILASFDKEIDSMKKVSNLLEGWHIVIDPGHGGLDPGAIVSVPDGNGNPVVITEDEYAYDIALRLYRALARNGASVSLTIIAPDHHVRDGENARQTFVHRKNEVYNLHSHNENQGWRPVGTADGLDMRKTIAGKQIADVPAKSRRKGSIFVSIHADNSSDLPAGTAVLFDGDTDEEVEAAQSLAAAMAPHLGAGAFIRQQSLRVLRDNPADAAVLVEARNIHFPRNAWALRSADLREQDAQMISTGILSWASLR